MQSWFDARTDLQAADSRSMAVRDLATQDAVQHEAPHAHWSQMGTSEHFVQFYETDEFLLYSVSEYIATALRSGDAAVVVATKPHREGVEERLQASGLGLAAARADGQYVSLDADETLSRFMVAGEPDPGRFVEIIGDIISRAAEGGRQVRIFGEMVALLAGEGNHTAVVRLEELWNGLQKIHSFSLFCAYPMNQFSKEAPAQLLGDVCTEHSSVIPAESYAALSTPEDRLRAITALQQKAKWLEAETAERKRVEERLWVALAAERAAREEAEVALRLRTEFLSIAGHDLRTPITILSGHIQLLLARLKREGELDPERLSHTLELVFGKVDKLSRLVNQLLDISRLEDGRLTLQRRPTDLPALLARVVSDARGLSDRHIFRLEVPPALQANVDALRLEQVLANLLDNAIRYSPEGGPIDVLLSQGEHDTVEISVREHGVGIPPEKRKQLVERFYQAQDYNNGFTAGWGLGLYISRQILELHGGAIRAEFPPDGGASFIARIPVGLRQSLAPSTGA